MPYKVPVGEDQDALLSEDGHTHEGGGGMEVHDNSFHNPSFSTVAHNHNLIDLAEKSYNSLTDKPSSGGLGYCLNILALNLATITDALTYYFGGVCLVPSTTAGNARIYFAKAGVIKAIQLFMQAATAGTAESISVYIRKNNSADIFVSTLSISSNIRVFFNSTLNIDIAEGDFIEIKVVCPTWATNPANVRFGGTVYVE